MTPRGRGVVALGVVLCFGLLSVSVAAQSTYRREQDARRACPGGEVVWVNYPYNHIYKKNTPGYGVGDGAYLCSSDMRRDGMHQPWPGEYPRYAPPGMPSR